MTISLDQIHDLRELAQVWPSDLVLIGAAALGVCHGMHWRSTSDLDLVVAIELDDMHRALPTGWNRTAREHSIIGARGTRFDVIPASPALRSAGSLTWRDGVVMNLTGIDLAFQHAVDHDQHGYRLRVAPPAVIAVLKMVAYLDRPSDRLRDLKDLAHLLDEYIGGHDDRRFDEALGVDYELAPAFLLGKDVGAITRSHPEITELLDRFLALVEGPAHGELRHQGPRSWRRDELGASARLTAFRTGQRSTR